MRAKEFITEHKKGFRARKYNKKPKKFIEPIKPKSPEAPSEKKTNKSLDKPTPTLDQLAKKHNVGYRYLQGQLQAGIKIELEHTSDVAIAKEIALDHLAERPDYYEKLKQVEENFADGKNPGRKGLAKRSGVNCKASVTSLRKTAKNSSGEKRRMAHWCANMKSGKQK